MTDVWLRGEVEYQSGLVRTIEECVTVADGETFDRVLENETLSGDTLVPPGESWLIGANVTLNGHLRAVGVGTRVVCRPGTYLKINGNPDDYVGGGMTYDPAVHANDYGLWLADGAVLDIQGTPKRCWTFGVVDPSWDLQNDEFWIAPTDAGDFWPRPWLDGDPIPQVDPTLPFAELMNATRDIVIEGPGHIHIHNNGVVAPHILKHFVLRNMGVGNASNNGQVPGRYALHLHHGGVGTAGTLIEGVVGIDCWRTFVPHASHGITMLDIAAIKAKAEAFWWDIDVEEDRTNDIVVDGLCVSGCQNPLASSVSRASAIQNSGGSNMIMRNCSASGARGDDLSNGYDWPSPADNFGPAMWQFDNNVAHNNEGAGLRFWFNNRHPHLSTNLAVYRNGATGIETGAYINAIRYQDALLFENEIVQHGGSNVAEHPDPPDGPGGVVRTRRH